MPELLPNTDAEPAEEEGNTRRAADPELLVMGRVLRMIEDLEEPARGRVVRWLTSRYADENNPRG